MTRRVSVTCTARLHLGFLDLNGGLGRRFGSVGLALDAPRTSLTLTRAAETVVRGPEQARAARHLQVMQRALDLPDGHALTIAAAIPAHGGLGSGTQLALAVATALRRLHGLSDDPRADAHRLGRGARSGVGIALFRDGGLAVDGGRGAADAPPPLLARLEIPAEWRILLVLDPHAAPGLSGAPEVAAFAALPAMRDSDSAWLCRLLVMQALPAVVEDDLPAFGAAIARIQQIIGDHFAPAQGGRFTSPRVAAALRTLADAGACGVGQSSWGPTGFAFARGAEDATRLARLADAPGLDIMICRGLNRGAIVAVDQGD